jgi:hypothetical protein
MAGEIDQIQFGKLIQSVDTLTVRVGELNTKVESLTDQMSGGKGVVAGLILAAGGIGAGASHVLDRMFR